MTYLNDYSVKTLRSLAAELKIKGRSTMDKVALVGAIGTVVNMDHDEALEMNASRKAPLTVPQAMWMVYKGIGNGRRTANYVRQNGAHKLTPAQNRRINKKGNREYGYSTKNLQVVSHA